MDNAGTVVKRERLIDEVWDTNWFGSTKTLDVHVSALRKKLRDDPSTPRYIHTVRGVGRFAGSTSRACDCCFLAFAYVLLAGVLALEVLLALNVSDRINAEVKAQAASGPARRGELVRREGAALGRIVEHGRAPARPP